MASNGGKPPALSGGGAVSAENQNNGASCLPQDAFSHFHEREAELLKYNDQLEAQKNEAMQKAQAAMAEVENLDFKHYQPSFLKRNAPGAGEGAAPATAAGLGSLAAHMEGAPATGAIKSHIGGAASATGASSVLTNAGVGVGVAEQGRMGLPSVSATNVQVPVPELPAPQVQDLAPAAMSQKEKHARPAAGANEVEMLQSTIRFQKARIIAIQEELDRAIGQLALRDQENSELKKELKTLSEEARVLGRRSTTADGANERLKKERLLMDENSKEQQREIHEMRRQLDSFSKKVREQDQQINIKDSKVNRLIEDCERYRTSLRGYKHQQDNKEQGEQKELTKLLNENRKLERQRNELTSAFKKQLQLIDVLKRQRTHLEAARVLSFTEDEFVRILDLRGKLGGGAAVGGGAEGA